MTHCIVSNQWHGLEMEIATRPVSIIPLIDALPDGIWLQRLKWFAAKPIVEPN